MSMLRRKDYNGAGYMYKSFIFGKDNVTATFMDVYSLKYSLRLSVDIPTLPLFIPSRFVNTRLRWA